jgi:hypothetical protein
MQQPLTPIYQQRLQTWTDLIKNVMDHFDPGSKDFDPGLKDIQHTDSITFAIRALQPCPYSPEMATQLQILKDLCYDIQAFALDFSQDHSALDSALKDDLDAFVKLSANLRTALVNQQWRQNTRDPWLADMLLQKHIHSCVAKLPRDKLIDQQLKFAAFEKVIVQTLTLSLAALSDAKTKILSKQLNSLAAFNKALAEVDPESDWNSFSLSNNLPNHCPSPSIDAISYDGKHDDLTKIVKQGPLLRKEGVFKREYKPFYGILTTCGYFHTLPPQQSGSDLLIDNPDQSIDLNDWILQPLMMNEKEPEEIAFVQKNTMLREVKLKVFQLTQVRGKTMNDSIDWWGIFNEQMRKQRKPVLESAEPVSPLAPKQPNSQLAPEQSSSQLASKQSNSQLAPKQSNSQLASKQSNSQLAPKQSNSQLTFNTPHHATLESDPKYPNSTFSSERMPPKNTMPTHEPPQNFASFDQAEFASFNAPEKPDTQPTFETPFAESPALSITERMDQMFQKKTTWESNQEDNVW